MVRAGYKQTELGLIPEEWEVKELKELLTFGSGKDYKHLQKGDIPVYGTGGVMTMVNNYLYDGDSVGIGRKGTIDKPVFLSNKFWTVDTLFYTHCFVDCLPKFIYYQFNRIPWKEYNEASGVPSLSKKTLEYIRIPLPSLKEQEAIAEALSDTDNWISSLEQLIAKKRLIKQGAMQELLTPKSDWEVKTLREVADYRNGKTLEKSIIKNGKYNVITLNSITIKGKLKKEHLQTDVNESLLKKGDIVMVLSDVAHGNFLGLCDIIPDDNFVLNQRMGALCNMKLVHSGFMRFLINYNQKYFKLSGKGSSQLNLGKDDILNFKFYLPSLSEQERIATILSDMDVEMEQLEVQLEKAKDIKQGMMQELLTGRVRLV